MHKYAHKNKIVCMEWSAGEMNYSHTRMHWAKWEFPAVRKLRKTTAWLASLWIQKWDIKMEFYFLFFRIVFIEKFELLSPFDYFILSTLQNHSVWQLDK